MPCRRRLLALALITFASRAPAADTPDLPVGGENTTPLAVGAEIPSATLLTPGGDAVDLRDLVRAEPTVVIVYRGGWCPFCNTHLGELATIEPDLAALGYRVVAFSPERPATLAAALADNPPAPGRLVLSDRAMHASRALGLAYEMPPAVHQRYLEHGFDLAPIPGRDGQHWLPVPAAYVCTPDGRIAFAYTNPDIRERVDLAELLAAAKAARE